MNVTVNGESRRLPEGCTVSRIVELFAVASDARGVAVAVDGEVVVRSSWAETELREGSHVEVLAAIGGG